MADVLQKTVFLNRDGVLNRTFVRTGLTHSPARLAELEYRPGVVEVMLWRFAMKLFVDTANLEELDQCLRRGFPSGVTTNPSILSKEKRRDFRVHINEMIRLLQRYGSDVPLSVEVFTEDPEEMIGQAEE